MKHKFFIAAMAALAVIGCGKDNGTQNGGDPVDENGISSLLIREKGQTEWASSINITLVTGKTTSIEYQILPESSSELRPRFTSDDVLVARVTQQGSVLGGSKKVGQSTTIRISVIDKEYATATIHVVPEEASKDPDGSKDPETSEDPSSGPKEKIVLDKSHWFFYCAVCDDFESIAEKTAHSGADEFSTWIPYDNCIVLLEDINDTTSYLEEPFEDDYPYTYAVGPDTYFEMDEPGSVGTGIWFYLDPATPYSGSGNDPFGNGQLELSFENDEYISGPYRPKGRYRGLIGWIDELQVDIKHNNGEWFRNVLDGNGHGGDNITVGDELRFTIDWKDNKNNIYTWRSKAENGFVTFQMTSSNNNIARVMQQGVLEGFWTAKVECAKPGEADITIDSGISWGKKGSKRVIHLTIDE